MISGELGNIPWFLSMFFEMNQLLESNFVVGLAMNTIS